MKEAEPRFFTFKVEDEAASKVTIQLTTIHGDPDLFISRKSKFPSFQDFETRSIRCGMYPEIIQYVKNESNPNLQSLVGDYYISVFGYVQSTFTLVYFVELEDGNISSIRLMTG